MSKNNAQLSVDTSFVRIFQEKTQFKTKRKKFQQQHKYCWCVITWRLGPYHVGCIPSRPIWEVKQRWSWLVLAWVTDGSMLISFWDRGVDVLNHFTRFCRTPLTFDTNYQKFDILKVFIKRKFSKNYFSIKSTFNSNFVVKNVKK